MQNSNVLLTQKVNEIYNWLDIQIKRHIPILGDCNACGKCCDFRGFDHLLFVTTPELFFLKQKLGPVNLKDMPGFVCPYNHDGKCSIYPFRFSGCRIFHCTGGRDFQSKISELTIQKLKYLCEQYNIPYFYSDLKTALNTTLHKLI